ncbi:MAG: hypothetical protein ABL891_11960 [Burkholderiales bacterium]
MFRNLIHLLTTTLLSTLSIALISNAAFAQTKPTVTGTGPEAPKTIMYVGNSFFYYNNSMHNQVSRIATAADAQNRAAYRSTSITMGGSGLNWHDVDSYFRPGGVASYSFVGDNEIRFNKFDKPFDVVIMMDCSQCPIHPQLGPMFHDYVKKHSATVRKHKAQPVLFMSWAYEDKPEMTAQLAEQYTLAGNANNALVIPAGLAFAKAIAKQPDIKLYVADKRHPTARGTYLAAATTYAALYRKPPAGAPHPATVDAATAKFLQEVAWETVQEYYGK